MNNTNIEIDKILNFAKNILNIKKVTLSHFVFHTDEVCRDKILVLNKFTLDNFEKYIQVAYKKGIKGVVVDIKISDILYSDSPELLIKFCKASSFCLSEIEILFAIL